MLIRTLILCYVVLLCSCGKESNCLKSAGKEQSISVELEAFDQLHIRDNVLVELQNANSYEASISFNEHLIDGISTRIENGILEIDNQNRCRWVKDLSIRPKVTISMPLNGLRSIHHYGSEPLTMEDSLISEAFVFEQFDAAGDASLLLNVQNLELKQHAGNATLKVAGSCDYLYLYNISLGKTDTRQLRAREAYVISNSIAEISANVANRVRCEIYNSGDVVLCPGPDSVETVQRGLGQVILCP